MRKFRRMLRHYVHLEATHCGHEPAAYQAFENGETFERFVRDEFERMARKLGEA